MKKKRIFIAINLPEIIKNKLVEYQKEIDEFFFEENFHPIRWTKKENLHITLEFLGYLTEEEILKVKEVLKNLVKNFSPFEVNLIEVRYGPKEEKIPRMIWVVGERKKEILDLKEKLDDKLKKSINFEPEKREFTPHITLGRIRKWQFKAIPLDERPKVKKEIDLNLKVNSIELMESILKRTGPDYKIIESFLLH